MKRLIALATCVALLGVVQARAIGEEHHIKAPLTTMGGSGVTGFVQLVQLPHGGTNIVVVASGLKPGQTYTSFYYESNNCTEPADKLNSFVADNLGNGSVQGKVDDDLDEIGSVSVRLGEGYGDLQACADVHAAH